MKKITKTFEELLIIDAMLGSLYQEFPKLRDSKFYYAYKRFYEKNIKKIQKEYIDELTDVRINNALEDKETKAILTDQKSNRGYLYSKDGLKKVIKDEKKVENKFFEKVVEIEPYFMTTPVPSEVSQELTEMLTGLIINE